MRLIKRLSKLKISQKVGERVGIRRKLWLSFLGIGIFFFLTVGIFYYYLSQMNEAYTDLIDRRMAILRDTDNIQLQAVRQINSLRAFLLSGDPNYAQAMTEANQTLAEILQQTNDLAKSSEEQDFILQIKSLNEDFITTANNVITHQDNEAKIELMMLISETPNKIAEEIQGVSRNFGSREQELLDQEWKENNQIILKSFTMVLVICVIILILLCFIGWMVSRVIVKPVVNMSEAVRRMASGDLTVDEIRVKNKDEIGDLADSFNQMNDNLRQLIQQISSHAEHVAAASEQLTASVDQNSQAVEQIASTMHSVSTGVDKQVKSVEEASQTFQNISRDVQHIAQHVEGVSNTAAKASHKSSEGEVAVQTAIQQMGSINQTVSGLAEVIRELGTYSKEISQIIEVITGISAQINLLALNAAIEAARAGEHGRGFAVVADEVRKLAEMSAQSAQQVSRLIVTIQGETTKAVQTMGIVTREVQSGMEIVNTAGKSFGHIDDSVGEVTSQIKLVSSAVQKIAVCSEQMVHTMELVQEVAISTGSGTQEVSAATEEQLASMEEISSSAHSLSEMVEDIRVLIGRFKV